MITSRLKHRVDAPRIARLIEPLEPRQLLAGSAQFTEPDGDLIDIQLTGPGTLVVNTAGLPTATITGSTIASELRFIVTQQGAGDGRGRWHRVEAPTLRLLFAPTMDFISSDTEIHFAGPVFDITVGDCDFGNIALTNTPTSFRTNLTARNVVGTFLSTTGTFERVTLQRFSSTAPRGLQAHRIGTLVINNTIGVHPSAFFDIRTTGTGVPFGVKEIRIAGGLAGGDWDINGPVQSIRVGGVAASGGSLDLNGPQPQPPLDVSIQGRLGALYSDRDLRGSWSAASFGAVQAVDDLVIGFTTGAIDSMRGEEVRINGSAFGGIKQIHARSELSMAVTTPFVDSLTTTGGSRGVGDFFQSGLLITGQPGKQWALGTMTLAGRMVGTSLTVEGNAKSITLGGMMQGANIKVGVRSDFVGSVVTAASDFAATGGLVQSLRINARPGDAVNFVTDSAINARRFTTIVSKANIDPVSAIGFFGVRFVDVPTTVNFRLPLPGSTITNPATVSAGVGQFVYAQVV